MSERPIDRALRRARSRGLNQTELANALGVDPQHITNWKRRGMPPEYHAKSADALDWSVDELLGRDASKMLDNDWPFPEIDARRISRMTRGEILQLQGVLIDKMAEIELSSQFKNKIRKPESSTFSALLRSGMRKR